MADAIALAYDANPTLQSQRAQLRATDENYVQAEAGYRPTISLNSTVTQSEQLQSGIFGGATEGTSQTGQTNITATQNLYTGGRVSAQVSVAEAQILEAREQLRGAENSLLFNVVQAYSDVVRDRKALDIQRGSLETLTKESDEIRARFEAGANTQTDVDQAQAQVEATRALVAAAAAQLENSTAEYVAYVGRAPGSLAPPPRLAAVPESVDQAFDVAQRESPTIRQALFAETAARAQIREARAAERPTVSFQGSYGEAAIDSPFDHHMYDHASSVSLNVSQPIFTGGTTQSQIRQAIEQDASQRLQISAARRTVVQSVAQAWGQRRGATLSAAADRAQVKVAQTTYDGMREEYRAGLRTTLDVLIAEQTLVSAEVALAAAEHDAYVAEASLMGSVGRLEARTIVHGLPLYSPDENFRKVENAGSFPLEFVPKALDRLGTPGIDRPQPIVAPAPPRSSFGVNQADPTSVSARDADTSEPFGQSQDH